MVYKIEISPSDIEKIEVNLKRKGLQLNEISYSINGFAIANVSTINPDDDTDDYWPSYYTVIIDVRTKECCKFDFYGHKTDGIKIFAKPQKGRHFIFDPCFDIKFISTIDGESTPYILVSYLDYDPNYKDDKDDYEGFIYTQIFTVSNNNLNFRSSRKFKFEDCSHYKNSVEVCLVDIESSCIFAYKQLSKCEYDSEYDIKKEHMYDFDGVWNTSLYCTDKRIIPLEDEDFLLDVVSNLKCEIEEQIRKEQEQEEFERWRNLD
ncbi:MAG: hypothetical protein J6R79_01340 [Bacteroidaceae bacterium]|nr:hypothetical protein [Bacteroidaceae bacterium]